MGLLPQCHFSFYGTYCCVIYHRFIFLQYLYHDNDYGAVMITMANVRLILPELFCAVLCTNIIHIGAHACEQFLNLCADLTSSFIF